MIGIFSFKLRNISAVVNDQCIVRVRLLRKLLFCKSFSDFRPIAIVSILRKVFQGVRCKLVQTKFVPRKINQCAFRKDFLVLDVVHFLSLLGQKCKEWGKPLFLLSADIPKAFDETAFVHIVSACLEIDIARIIIAYWIRE